MLIILVGTQTVIADNPKLNVRDWTGKNPIRIVLDLNNRLPADSHVFSNEQETIVINNKNINVKNNIAQEIANLLYNQNIQSVIIEGGRQTIQTFIDANLWDEARVFVGNTFFENGTKALIINKSLQSEIKILDDRLLIFRNE